jgi:hypothetical protein
LPSCLSLKGSIKIDVQHVDVTATGRIAGSGLLLRMDLIARLIEPDNEDGKFDEEVVGKHGEGDGGSRLGFLGAEMSRGKEM